ncbi:MAG: hypothetical protein ACOC0P_04335 [Planctomycetota bacterium]
MTMKRITTSRMVVCTILSGVVTAGACTAQQVRTTPAPDRPVVGEVSRPHSEFQIGNAVSPINYWMTAWMLNDMFRMAGFESESGDTRPSRAWIPTINGEWIGDRRWDVPTDNLGWPMSLRLQGGDRADRLTSIIVGHEFTDVFPTGTYRVLWEGEGELLVEGPANVVEVGPQELNFEYDGTSEIFLSILETDPDRTGNYIRNIQVLRPDAVPGERFNRTYLEEIRPYAVIRPLHLLGDQLTYGPRIAWEDRKPENYSHWGGSLGAPYEIAIDLANQSDSDLWLNVPIAASDNFMQNLANLAFNNLDRDRRLYIELGNELWNWAMPYELGRQYVLSQARERWPGVEGTIRPWSDGEPVNEAMMLHSWQGARTAEMAQIFRGAFGDASNRVVVVLAGQVGASQPFWDLSRLILESPVWVGEEGASPAATYADAFAVAPYVSEEEGVIEFSRTSPRAFIGDAIRYTRGEDPWGPNADEPGLRYLIRSDRALAAEFDLPLITYEGGQHFIGSIFTRDRVNPHPDMALLYETLFDVWREEGGGLFTHFAGIIPRGVNEPGTDPTYYQTENFGIKELQTQTEANAPKWRALRNEMRELGQLRN